MNEAEFIFNWNSSRHGTCAQIGPGKNAQQNFRIGCETISLWVLIGWCADDDNLSVDFLCIDSWSILTSNNYFPWYSVDTILFETFHLVIRLCWILTYQRQRRWLQTIYHEFNKTIIISHKYRPQLVYLFRPNWLVMTSCSLAVQPVIAMMWCWWPCHSRHVIEGNVRI